MTAAGILWGPCGVGCVVAVAVAATASVAVVDARDGHPSLPRRGRRVLAVAVVGVAFTIAVGLRVHDVRHHPIVVALRHDGAR